jgi:phosphoribosyl-AMP cyclohydrolase
LKKKKSVWVTVVVAVVAVLAAAAVAVAVVVVVVVVVVLLTDRLLLYQTRNRRGVWRRGETFLSQGGTRRGLGDPGL